MLLVYIWLQETTTKPCDKSLLIDNSEYQKLFGMTMKSDGGTTHPTAWQALRYSGAKGWRSMLALEDELFIMNFTLHDKCSENWEIATISFTTQYAKHIQLEAEGLVLYSWVRKLSIISKVLVIVIVNSELLRRYSRA